MALQRRKVLPLPLPLALVCPRCGNHTALSQFAFGCEHCRVDGVSVNLVPIYTPQVFTREMMEQAQHKRERSLWRYRTFLPLAEGEEEVSLGEGETPLVPLRRFATGLDGELWLKNESCNPTWSHKDRAMTVAVSKARAWNVPMVVGASSGNAGAALAAYAAPANLPCVIFTSTSIPQAMLAQMQTCGAYVLLLERSKDRGPLMRKCIQEWGWYPCTNFTSPPIGSNPYGIEGYKTVAYEIFAACYDKMPDSIVVPTEYGDLLTGICRGFADLQTLGFLTHVPRLVIAEVAHIAPYTHALSEQDQQRHLVPVGKPTVAFSIDGDSCTEQALRALHETHGFSLPVSEEAIIAGQLELGRREGIYLEMSSVVGVVAGRQLLRDQGGRVMVIGTSTGLKEPASTLQAAIHSPLIAPSLEDVHVTLKRTYGFNM